MPAEELKFKPDDRDALEPATDEQKEESISIINALLSDIKWGDGIVDPKSRKKEADFHLPDKRAVSIFRFENRKDNLVAIITVTEVIERQQTKIINYHFKKTPIDFQVEKKVNFDNGKLDAVFEKGTLEEVDALISHIESLIEADAFEKEVGLQFFSKQDAAEVLSLLRQVKVAGDTTAIRA